MRLYFRYAAMNIRSQMQYNADFLLTVFGQLTQVVTSFLSIVLLFGRFGSLAGYSFGEVALCYAVTFMGFALAEIFARGYDRFAQQIVRGNFDRLLLRPRALFLQVLGSDFDLFRGASKLIFSSVVLVVAVAAIETVWTPLRTLTVALMIVGGGALMAGVFILTSTLCFFTIQGLEVMNIITDGGRQAASYPMTIYERWFRLFFTFVIPLTLVNYLPLQYVMGQTANPLYMLMPLAAGLFLFPAVGIWYLGARRYVSTGS